MSLSHLIWPLGRKIYHTHFGKVSKFEMSIDLFFYSQDCLVVKPLESHEKFVVVEISLLLIYAVMLK